VEVLHFLGEVEAVFGIWAVALFAAMAAVFGPRSIDGYVTNRVNFTEAVFVVVIMAVASTRPVLAFAEKLAREASVAVSPGIGFGADGDAFVRFALVENEQRIGQAVRGIRKLLDAGG